MWLCSKHKASNQESMDRKASDLDHKHGLKLAHFLGCSRPVPTPPSSQPQQLLSTPVLLHGEPRDIVTVGADLPAVTTTAFRTAEKKLKKKSAADNNIVEVVPIPDGEPMFMFQPFKRQNQGC